MPLTQLGDPDIRRLLDGRLHDPFRVLGPHTLADGRRLIRTHLPGAEHVELVETREPMRKVGHSDLFEWIGPADRAPAHCHIQVRWSNGDHSTFLDPYSFSAWLDAAELERFSRGECLRAWRFMGAHPCEIDGVSGTRFSVWAPNAERVSVVGNFNAWDGRRHPMRVCGHYGVWVLFIPELPPGELYKYEIINRDSKELLLKSDPFAQSFEHRPSTASIVRGPSKHIWSDQSWMQTRTGNAWLHKPMSIYEVHLGSWRRSADGGFMNYREIAVELADYLREMAFTHVELMPITEHPLDESWGYQTTGYFAPTRRFGTPDDLRFLVDHLHQHGIGVILDWVPGHFPRDEHALARFDGTALFEYPDTRKGEHAEWGTLVFNYDRNEVRSFLRSSAIYWLEEFHFDGLRVDAVASMLYLDYARNDGEWVPNIHGGNENLEAVAFLQKLNEDTHRECPGSVTIAEESTAWPGVSRPTTTGGLGFSLKWNMGWMHDTLAYMSKDPVHRKFHHNLLTFGPVYAFSENFVLPFSHDEVVHMKGSVLGRMPGDRWQRLANLRLTYTFQWTYPGKKLLFMGSEFAQETEWNHREELPWRQLDDPAHAGVQRLVCDLNSLHREQIALHQYDFDARGFQWLNWTDAEHSTLAYMRKSDNDEVIVLLNFTPVPRHGYRVGVPRGGIYREIFNSDSRFYGGSDLGNPADLHVEPMPWMDQPGSIVVTLPPLAGIILRRSAAVDANRG